MTHHIQSAVRVYDLLAPHYRLLERLLFGRTLQVARVAMLPYLPMVDRALFLGDGDGRLLRQFVQSQPGCQVTTVDQSNRMLQRQSDCLEEFDSQDTIRYLQSDARDLWLEPKSYDLLVTAFFVDCFPESQLEDVLPRWLQAIRSGGYFYFVDFSRPTAGWRRFRAECYLDVMHREIVSIEMII